MTPALFGRRPFVLAIGSAHLDVIAEYEDSDVIDKIGTIAFSVGGTAYNVAANLARHGVPCSLLTYLPEESIVTPLILDSLRAYRVGTRDVHGMSRIEGRRTATMPESGFVAHRRRGQLTAAVSAAAISEITFRKNAPSGRDLRKALRGAALVVVDCNLSVEALRNVADAAREACVPLVAAVVSEAKIRRLFPLASAVPRIDLVTANEAEIAIVLRHVAPSLPVDIAESLARPASVTALCATLSCRMLSISNGERGSTLCFDDGRIVRLRAPAFDGVRLRSTTGAGDALTAALVELLSRDVDLTGVDVVEIESAFDRYIPEVLASAAGTPDAKITFEKSEEKRASGWLDRSVGAVREALVAIGVKSVIEIVLAFLAGYLLNGFGKTFHH